MKQFTTYLSKIWRLLSKHEHTHVILDRRLTVGSPSELTAKIEQKDNLSPSCLLLASYLPLTRHRQLRYAVVILFVLLGCVSEAWGTASLRVTLTFENNSNEPWGFPSGSSNKTTTSNSYTNGGYTITLAGGGSSNGYYAASQDLKGGIKQYYLIMGKSGATLTLPTFSFNTTKIVVKGRSSASVSVEQNIYVGETAVSTSTTGATGTNTYNINSTYQAAGTTYVLKVTSSHNTQIASIEIWGEDAASCSADPTVGAASVNGSFF